MSIEIGKKYGNWTVIKFSRNTGHPNYQKYYLCKCDCGNISEVNLSTLTGGSKYCKKCSENSMIGKRFGKLTVESVAEKHESKVTNILFKCKCDCGNYTIVASNHLKSGHTKSCGKCLERTYIGKRFGHLTVIDYAGRLSRGNIKLKVECDCGNKTTVLLSNLTSKTKPVRQCRLCYKGYIDSYKKDVHDRIIKLSSKYASIHDRTNNPSNISFYNYGGRGIKLTMSKDEFIKAYYMNTDIDVKNLTVDRIDNNGNYSLDNIRWVSLLENNDNRLYNSNMTYDDVSNRLMTDSTFVKVCNINKFDKSEFYVVEFPIKSKIRDDNVKLYVHYTLGYKLEDKVNRIKDFYLDCGKNIAITSKPIIPKIVEECKVLFKEFCRDNNISGLFDLSNVFEVFKYQNIKYKGINIEDMNRIYGGNDER